MALTGTYGVNKEDSQLLSKEFAPLENREIRRGEVLYPAYLATIINVFLNEMDKSQLTVIIFIISILKIANLLS